MDFYDAKVELESDGVVAIYHRDKLSISSLLDLVHSIVHTRSLTRLTVERHIPSTYDSIGELKCPRKSW